MNHLAKQLQGLTGLVTLLAGFLAALGALKTEWLEFFGIFKDWEPVHYGITAGVLFLLGLPLFWSARQKYSKLLNPEAFRLNPRNPDHLVGRSEDIDLLEKACLNHPLVLGYCAHSSVNGR